MGTIRAVCLSERKGEQKSPVDEARLIAGFGFEGDAHAGDWHRQVSLLDLADIEIMRSKGAECAFGAFGENLVVEGLPLGEIGLGSVLRIGADAVLRISQIGKTCHTRCAIYYQIGDCIMPRNGLFARVEQGERVATGDRAEIESLVPRSRVQAVVLTISDRGARGETADTAGPAVADLLAERLGAHVYRLEILPDERAAIEDRLRHYCDGHSIDLVLTVGGTGFSPRDVTPEATRAVVERPTPGLDEAMRAASLALTPRAMLSRAASGIRQTTLIVNLPGSKRAAVENLEAILPALPHGIGKLRGSQADCGQPGRS
ncbi:MAG TPA: molybdopterin-binding protein [Sumerlaeia bacterium]|nr:molybdopterin-binding protein [Sumerlaeia bacterium]